MNNLTIGLSHRDFLRILQQLPDAMFVKNDTDTSGLSYEVWADGSPTVHKLVLHHGGTWQGYTRIIP